MILMLSSSMGNFYMETGSRDGWMGRNRGPNWGDPGEESRLKLSTNDFQLKLITINKTNKQPKKPTEEILGRF